MRSIHNNQEPRQLAQNQCPGCRYPLLPEEYPAGVCAVCVAEADARQAEAMREVERVTW